MCGCVWVCGCVSGFVECVDMCVWVCERVDDPNLPTVERINRAQLRAASREHGPTC